MLQEHDDRLRIIRARTILDMLGERPATGRDLFRPLKGLDNAALLVRGGRVLDVLPWKSVRVPAGTPVTDMGDVTLMPGSINAHCHLQLSHTAGRTLFGAGFTAWLRSLIALLREEHDGTALIGACRDMAAAGTAHVGDYAGDGLLAVDAAVRAEGMGVTHFCEWFGGQAPFIDDGRPWPPRCRALLERRPEVAVRCAPAGHALYSTDARVLQDARQWCRLKGRPFALHLAESEDETRLLLDGEGPLWDCYRGMVLPEDWAVPHLRPVAYARRLGLLGPGTLAVHGVQLEPAEVEALAASGSALCLCPRSNDHLAVGTAPVASLLESGLLCCLGTDGLSSNTDLDVRREAVFLRETLDVAPQALIRCLTVNGAAALGLAGHGRLEPGSRAVFSVLPGSLSV